MQPCLGFDTYIDKLLGIFPPRFSVSDCALWLCKIILTYFLSGDYTTITFNSQALTGSALLTL